MIREAQIRARSRMYMRSAREAFERGQMRAYRIPELPAYPGDGSTECLTNCRCSWRFVITDDGIDCYWDIDWDAENCQDCIDRHYMWNPYFAKADPVPPPPMKPPPTKLAPQTHRGKLASQPYSSVWDSWTLASHLAILMDEIPDHHLQQINDILVTNPPLGYVWLEDEGCWARWVPKAGTAIGCFSGLYLLDAGIAYVHPSHLRPGTTLFREVAFSLVQAWALSVFTPQVLVPLLQFGAPGHNWVQLGLRARSFYNAYEFATDVYQVWKSGTDEQFAILSSLLLEQGVNLEGLFGARLA